MSPYNLDLELPCIHDIKNSLHLGHSRNSKWSLSQWISSINAFSIRWTVDSSDMVDQLTLSHQSIDKTIGFVSIK
jgi:hypothetical protein